MINEKYLEVKKEGIESAPLTFEILNSVPHTENEKDNEKMKSRHWRFLFICCAFGLRPSECSRLLGDKKNKFHEFTKPDQNGIFYLKIYQPKLITLEVKNRWKSIPILFEEQRLAIEFIKAQNFKKPLTKTIHNFISPKHNNYGGRKGFLDEMLKPERGPQLFENISLWLGHTSLDRSLRNYKQRNRVQYLLMPTKKDLKIVSSQN